MRILPFIVVLCGCAAQAPTSELTSVQQLDGWLRVQAGLEQAECHPIEATQATYCWVESSQEGVLWRTYATGPNSATAEVYRCQDEECPDTTHTAFKVVCEDGSCWEEEW